jgi:catechol 2,3-dioxygenase
LKDQPNLPGRNSLMSIPSPVYDPPFNITRASHVVLTVRDLAASRRFYTEVIGLAVSAEEGDALYLRGLEEACHHSLVLKRTSGQPVCERVGFRVFTEDDLVKAHAYYAAAGLPAAFVEVPHQGRTLHVSDPFGTPLEFCASMEVMPRLLTQFHLHKGGRAHRLDHFQILLPDVQGACTFYMKQGFRLSEYVVTEQGETIVAAFLQRKGNPHDLVLFNQAGPRIHHFAFTTVDAHTLLHVCDVAGNLGYGLAVERGPGRHGPGHAQYVYFRDPDGHRIELFTTHYQIMDIENAPVRWDPNHPLRKQIWGLPAQRAWVEEGTRFPGVEVRPPLVQEPVVTLEKFLAARG